MGRTNPTLCEALAVLAVTNKLSPEDVETINFAIAAIIEETEERERYEAYAELFNNPPDAALFEMANALTDEVQAKAPAADMATVRANYMRAWKRILAKITDAALAKNPGGGGAEAPLGLHVGQDVSGNAAAVAGSIPAPSTIIGVDLASGPDRTAEFEIGRSVPDRIRRVADSRTDPENAIASQMAMGLYKLARQIEEESANASLEFWRKGDYFKFVGGKKVHATASDYDGIHDERHDLNTSEKVEYDGSRCSANPLAPHGFDRSESINQDRYVCTCEGWVPPAIPGVRDAS